MEQAQDTLLRQLGETLDDLGLALCVFDAQDCTQLWNRSFLHLFPEHAGAVHVGEPYRENLRRFYQQRLGPDDLPWLERYMDEGLARHRTQQRAYSFEHHGQRLDAASLALPGGARLRIWQAQARAGGPAGDEPLPPAEVAAIVQQLPDALMVCSRAGVIRWVNDPFARMYGLVHAREAAGMRFEALYRRAWAGVEESATPLDDALAALPDQIRFAGNPIELPLPGGRYTRVIAQRGPTGLLVHAHVDITQLKRQQLELRQAEARLAAKSALLEATLQRMDQGVIMVNAERIVEVCNARAVELLGLPPELMARQPHFEEVLRFQWQTDEFVHTPDDIKDFVRSGGILDTPQRYDRVRPNGRVVEVQSVPIDGGGVLRTYTDITERKQAEERMRHVARHDGLTTLINRDAFLEAITAQLERARREGDGFAVHFIDLDDFKPVNDRHGHAVGDRVLAATAARMRSGARDADIVARMGGDEFAVMQRRTVRPEAALGLGRRLLQAIRQPLQMDGLQLHIGASIGVALFPAHGADVNTLMRHADGAMYAAKAAGGHRVQLHTDSDEAPPAGRA